MRGRQEAVRSGRAVERTHCGEGAPQSTHLLFSFVFWISRSFDRVSGSTSHILLILGGVGGGVIEGWEEECGVARRGWGWEWEWCWCWCWCESERPMALE